MNLATKELRRQPRRFGAVGVALTLLVVLLVVLGGFLDGLERSQTGAYRAHEGMLIAFADDADRQVQRSEVSASAAEGAAELDGVAAVGGLDRAFTVAAVDGELVDIVLFGHDLATDRIPAPSAGAEVVVDAQLEAQTGVAVGDSIVLGGGGGGDLGGFEVEIVEVIDDLTQGAPTVWTTTERWRELVAAVNPAGVPAEGGHQALVIALDDGADLDAVRAGLAEFGLDAVTPAEAVDALDVVQQQSSTFSGIIGVTFVVTLLVVALFFALLTLERVDLYAVLKALGASSGELLRGVSIQAAAVSAVAVALGIVLALGFVAVLPPELPVRLQSARLVQIAVGTVVTAVIGSLFTARRLLRVDPAEAIG